MERITMDITVPFIHTQNGNRFLCMAIGYLMKGPWVCALPNHEAETVAGGVPCHLGIDMVQDAQ